MDKQKQQEAYRDYVKWKTPVHNLPLNMAKAFVTGGTICLLGQMILNKCEAMGLDQDVCGSVTSVSLILLSVLLTGWNLYPRIAKWGGAGALVPITGLRIRWRLLPLSIKRRGRLWGSDVRYLPLRDL